MNNKPRIKHFPTAGHDSAETDLYMNWLKLNDKIRDAKKKLETPAHEAPEVMQRIQPKIIPFPGVVLKQEDKLQN